MHLPQQSFAIFLLLALGCATKASPGPEVSDRIHDGFRADIISYPYQVALAIHKRKKNGKAEAFSCGGVIIKSDVIITAAHCVIPPDITYDPVRSDDVEVFANRSVSKQANQGSQLAHVKRIDFYPHTHYKPQPAGARQPCIENDMALLQLTNPLTLGPGVQSIPVAKENSKLHANTKAVITGYGDTDVEANLKGEGSNHNGQLYAAEVKIADDTVCKVCYGRGRGAHPPLKNVICAGQARNGPGTLSGDSGGPLVVDGVLEGITACRVPAVNNESNCPAAFVRLADFGMRSFIEASLRKPVPCKSKTGCTWEEIQKYLRENKL